MRAVCSSCDAEGTAGAACAKCGAMVVWVDDEDLTGQTLGAFRLVGRIGAGGMGTVYRATQHSVDRPCAVKVIDRALARDAAAVKRFVREGTLASKLAHPNIVSIYELGQTDGGRLYLAMELIEGKTLYDVIAGGRLPIARIQRITSQLLDALEAAHAQSIVHRDLKPENVMVDADDRVKVLDFGLARSFVDPQSRATATGVIAGTPRYLPPEVALDGAGPAPSQDLYALGVMLGELATGGPLWEGTSLTSLFAQKLEAPPKLVGVQPALVELILALLATAPGERPGYPEIRLALAALDPYGEAPRVIDRAGPGSGPAPAAVEPSAQARPLTSSAFAPPRSGPPALELETEWLAEKEARRAPRPPPPRRWGPIIGAFVGVALVAGVAGVVVNFARRPPAAEPPTERALPGGSGMVEISVRSVQPAEVTFDGHRAGRTPLTLELPRGTHPVVLEATLGGKTQAISIVPDRDQVIRLQP